MGGLEFKLDIPSGLTIVDGSISIPTGLETTIDSDGAIVVPTSGNGYKWSYSAQSTGYTGTLDLVILTFSCTVDDGVSGSKDVSINVDTFFDNDPPYPELDYTVTPATVNVTAAPKPAAGISLNKSTLELTVGESETLVATVEPADTTDTVTWDTGRSDIATVDSTGKITAVAPGTAVIAARAGEKSAFCTVTVVAAPCTHTNKTNVDAKSSTCKEQGWEAYSKCDDCGQLFDKDGNEISAIPYLSLADHKYTANEKKPEALKTAGTCKDKAIYLRSCEVCGKVAPSEAWGSFFGDLDPNNHAGGTTTVKASEPDHKNQIDGYTGDTKCLGCGEIIGTGTSIPAGAHTPSSTWNSDGEYHWKTCTVAGCGVIIDGSKAAHTSTGANVATCQHKAVCDACNVEYGEKAAHNPSSGWTSDASGHWHACQTAGCTEKCGLAAHTPDREAATETDPIKCSVCDYEIAPALGMQDYILEMPVFVSVKLTGDEKPGKETFKLEIYDCGVEDAEFEILNDVLTAEDLEFVDGGAYFYGLLEIKVTGEDQLCNLTEGFNVRMVKGTAKGWTYASEQWNVTPIIFGGTTDAAFYFGYDVREIVDGEISEIPANGMSFTLGYEAVTEPATEPETEPATEPETEPATEPETEPATEPETEPATEPETPKTGDSSMLGLWIALLAASGVGVAGTVIYSRKKKYSAK